jgi:N-methylhydantoinase A
MRYRGQSSELKIPVPNGELGSAEILALGEAFNNEFHRVYGRANRRVGVEILNWQVQASGPKPNLEEGTRDSKDVESVAPRSRKAFFEDVGYVDTPVLTRAALKKGTKLHGPLLVEEPESTTVIPPDATLTVDDYLNLVITFDARSHAGNKRKI